jgi:hypothetical protein
MGLANMPLQGRQRAREGQHQSQALHDLSGAVGHTVQKGGSKQEKKDSGSYCRCLNERIKNLGEGSFYGMERNSWV